MTASTLGMRSENLAFTSQASGRSAFSPVGPRGPTGRRTATSCAVDDRPVGVADVVLASTAAVVPIDRDSLSPSGKPFDGFPDAVRHYRRRPDDGVGLRLGRQRDGSVLVAVRGHPLAWDEWTAQHGRQVRPVFDDAGSVVGERVHHDIPPHVTVRCGRVVWLAWSVGPRPTARGVLRLMCRDRGVGLSVRLLASGVMPFSVARSDGSELVPSGLPVTIAADEWPGWLTNALAGRWSK